MSTWALVGKILRRSRHELWQNALAQMITPNAGNSRAVQRPVWLLAVSEGQTLAVDLDAMAGGGASLRPQPSKEG